MSSIEAFGGEVVGKWFYLNSVVMKCLFYIIANNFDFDFLIYLIYRVLINFYG